MFSPTPRCTLRHLWDKADTWTHFATWRRSPFTKPRHDRLVHSHAGSPGNLEGKLSLRSHTLAPFGGLATASLARPSVAASIVTPAMMAVAPKACIKLNLSPKTRIETINTPTMWL